MNSSVVIAAGKKTIGFGNDEGNHQNVQCLITECMRERNRLSRKTAIRNFLLIPYTCKEMNRF